MSLKLKPKIIHTTKPKKSDNGLKFFFLQNDIIYKYYYIKRLVVTSLEDITQKISPKNSQKDGIK